MVAAGRLLRFLSIKSCDTAMSSFVCTCTHKKNKPTGLSLEGVLLWLLLCVLFDVYQQKPGIVMFEYCTLQLECFQLHLFLPASFCFCTFFFKSDI